MGSFCPVFGRDDAIGRGDWAAVGTISGVLVMGDDTGTGVLGRAVEEGSRPGPNIILSIIAEIGVGLSQFFPFRNETGRGDHPRPIDLRLGGAQAGCHSRLASPQFLLKWTCSSTLDTQLMGMTWCIPSGLSFLVSLMWPPWT